MSIFQKMFLTIGYSMSYGLAIATDGSRNGKKNSMPIDQNGIVTIEQAIGELNDSSALLTGANQPEVSIPALVTTGLSLATEPLRVCIDTGRRKIFMADEAFGMSAYATALAGTKKVQTLAPVAASEGRSVQWEQTARDVGMVATMPDAIKAAIDPARPYRALSALLSTILSKAPDGKTPFIYIDQSAGTVRVVDYLPEDEADLRASFDNAFDGIDGAIEGVAISLAEPAAEGGSASLKFEGGAF